MNENSFLFEYRYVVDLMDIESFYATYRKLPLSELKAYRSFLNFVSGIRDVLHRSQLGIRQDTVFLSDYGFENCDENIKNCFLTNYSIWLKGYGP